MYQLPAFCAFCAQKPTALKEELVFQLLFSPARNPADVTPSCVAEVYALAWNDALNPSLVESAEIHAWVRVEVPVSMFIQTKELDCVFPITILCPIPLAAYESPIVRSTPVPVVPVSEVPQLNHCWSSWYLVLDIVKYRCEPWYSIAQSSGVARAVPVVSLIGAVDAVAVPALR